MDCERVRDFLSDSLDGTLPEAESAEVRAHLALCPDCESEREGLRLLLEELSSLPPLAAPPELLGRIREEIGKLPGGTDGRNFRETPEGRASSEGAPSPRWGTVPRVAATLLLVALGYGAGRAYFRSRALPPASAVTASLSSPAERQGGADAGNPSRTASPPAHASASKGEGGSPAKELSAVKPAGTGEASMAVPRRLPQEIPSVAQVSDEEGGGVPAPVPPPRILIPHPTFHRAPAFREVILVIPAEARRDAVERVVTAARRCGALPPGHPPLGTGAPPSGPDTVETVRVTLPSPEAARFVSELQAIGNVAPAFSVPPQAAEEGEDVALTVRLVSR